MKNKKGFTLIEMLVVIAVMGTIMAAIGVSVDGMNKRTLERSYKSSINQIFKASQIYSSLPSKLNDYSNELCSLEEKCTLNIENLIEAGLLEDNILNQINPLSNSENFVYETKIYVYYDNYVKYMELNYDTCYVSSDKENQNYYEKYKEWRRC